MYTLFRTARPKYHTLSSGTSPYSPNKGVPPPPGDRAFHLFALPLCWAKRGISVGGEETKLLQYSDDMTAVLADVSSAQALFDLLETFKKASGLTINLNKTEGMWIGSSRKNKAKPFGIKWPSEPIKALGIFNTYDQKLLLEKNL